MEIKELFSKNTIKLDIQSESKDEVISEMIDMLFKDNVLNDKEAYTKAIYDREDLSSTGIGFGIAIPHAKSNSVSTPRVAFGISKKGVDYDSADGEKVNLIFMIAATAKDNDLHLQALAALSRKLVNPVFRNNLLKCETIDEIMNIINSI